MDDEYKKGNYLKECKKNLGYYWKESKNAHPPKYFLINYTSYQIIQEEYRFATNGSILTNRIEDMEIIILPDSFGIVMKPVGEFEDNLELLKKSRRQ